MATAFTERFALIIDADGKGAIREFGKVGDVADKELTKASKSTAKFGSQLTSLGAKGLATTAVLGVGLFKLGSAASDVAEAQNKANVIFEDGADTVTRFASAAAKSAGLSKAAALGAASTFGQFANAAGKSGEDAARFSVTLSQLAGDLASFNNTSVDDAVTALGAALRGEQEPIRRFGVLLDDATLKQRALQMGLVQTTTGTLPPAIKVQAAYAEILAQTTKAQGDFARTADGAANQQRILKAEFQNLQASLGEGVLPVMNGVLGGLNDIVGAFNRLPGPVKQGTGELLAFGTAALGAVSASSFVAGNIIKATTAMQAFSVSAAGASTALFLANPAVGAVALGLTALVAGFIDSGDEADNLTVDLKELNKEAARTGQTLGELAQKKAFETFTPDAQRLARALGEGGLASAIDTATGAVESFRATGEVDKAAIVDWTGKVYAASDALGIHGKALGEVIDYVHEQSRVAADALDVQREAERRWASSSIAAYEYSKSVNVVTASTEDEKAAVEASNDALKEQRDRVRDANDALRDQISTLRDSLGLTDSYARAQLDTADAAQRQTEAVTASRDAKGRDAEANRDAARATLDLKQAVLDQSLAYARSKGAADDSRESVRLQIDELGRLREQFPSLRREIDQYIATLRAIPARVTTSVVASGLGDIVHVTRGENVARAAGGPVAAGQMVRVNEGGKPVEYWQPNTGGTVIPLGDSRGGGGTLILNVYDATDPEKVIDAVKRYERVNGASWRAA